MARLLTFLAPADPPFSICGSGPGEFLDLFVSYDVARQEAQNRMDLLLHRTDGGQSKARTCFLSPEEQAVVRREMEDSAWDLWGRR